MKKSLGGDGNKESELRIEGRAAAGLPQAPSPRVREVEVKKKGIRRVMALTWGVTVCTH